MIILSDDYYFTRGMNELFKNEKDGVVNKSVNREPIVVYDRGDGLASLIPSGIFLSLRLKEDSLLYLLSTRFITYDYKKNSLSELATLIFNARDNYKRKIKDYGFLKLTYLERRILDAYLNGYDLKYLSIITGKSMKSLYAANYRLLERVNINSVPLLIKVYRQWNKNINWRTEFGWKIIAMENGRPGRD